MIDPPPFDCGMCGSATLGNGRADEGAMLCRDCHHEFIYATGDTLEEKLRSIGYGPESAAEVAEDMRALFAARGDAAALAAVCRGIAARESRPVTRGRDHITDIAALAASRHITACSGIPITQRVQTSGRESPDPPRASVGASRAMAILGRGYAAGGLARRYALALWVQYGHADKLSALDLALALTFNESERLALAASWPSWGKGPGANRLAAVGAELVGRAIGWYQDASDEPGHSGVIGQLLEHGDAARGSIKRMALEHETRLARERKAAKMATTKGATR